ncbi:MAG: hypothetical protein SF182_13150 [Deltaproteobacteria bacterium]|nr:hypothetical protein [Deltaproteobacteria bacterium]
MKATGAFRQVAHTQRAAIRRCLANADAAARAGRSIDNCIADDRQVWRSVAETHRMEARLCAAAPEWGYVPDTVTGAAIGAESAFVHDVLGASVVAPAERAARRCQLAVLAKAGRCADRFVADYADCARAALSSAVDARPLVRCKGSDASGAVAAACGRSLAETIAARCAGQDLAALFPACAGADLARCLAGHAKARASRGLNTIGGLCPVLGPPPPPPEPIDLHVVPMPADVSAPQFPWWSADGNRLLFGARITGYDALQIATIAPDGGDFRCLTCPLAGPGDPPLNKPIAFPDGKRVMLRVGTQSVVAAADHAVLECTPSVVDCQSAALLPIVIPAADDPAIIQDQREFRVAPDNLHVGFTQARRDTRGTTGLVSIVGVLQRFDHHYEVADPRVVSPIGELKEFSRDGQAVYVISIDGSPVSTANSETVRVSLADGSITPVTRHPDYDEPVTFSADDAWHVIGSGRGSGLVATVAQVPRSPLINVPLVTVTKYFFLTALPPLIEPWLVDRYGERGDYIGQALHPTALAEGWDGKFIANWHPDGTRIVWWQEALAGGASRIVIAQLSSRAPITSPVVPSPMPSLAWAPALEGFLPPGPADPVTTAGTFSGLAQVSFTPGASNRLEIRYTDYSDDGEHFVDGVESFDYTTGMISAVRWDADVRLHGCRQGFVSAQSAEFTVVTSSGSVVSEVDGTLLALPR